ncbi:PA3371 family protein [Stutzerimonas kirkiae]|uniref:Uncharacterized protein n=1 Tax=Stutzerimonas kirkiae TaxID=2211392 RepID=A0A4Q9RA08_9GAMM|nr:PA3371 family protein [Stutzerimonas kirkiae]TBU96803.1 hypothetical protein DNJ96_09560 [Stutzerimonas kirkiae]TBV01043.1 hypothetical protein DNJ95_13130 [Stutzerimonas kirkiae]TBV08391.1 hypothetical protein DNK08_10770 [Stutzerimonas kirkiae]TBV16662.1 hypothetical protein DNK01_02035 [Stutzerimonas kirkiae]
MSRLALTFLTLAAGCALLAFLAPAKPAIWEFVGKTGAAINGVLFLAALLVGRRIKFDPVLR